MAAQVQQSAKLVSMARAKEIEVVEVVDFVKEERVFPAWTLELDHRWCIFSVIPP